MEREELIRNLRILVLLTLSLGGSSYAGGTPYVEVGGKPIPYIAVGCPKDPESGLRTCTEGEKSSLGGPMVDSGPSTGGSQFDVGSKSDVGPSFNLYSLNQQHFPELFKSIDQSTK